MANTTKGYPYPIDTDSADVPSDVQLLAEAVDTSPGIASLTQTQIDALSAGMKWAGRVVWNQTTNKLQRSDGSSFVDLVLTSDSRLTDARTPSAHASSHGSAGSDPITIAQSQVTDLSSALAAKLDASAYTPGLGLITRQTFSSVATVSLDNCFTATYTNYRIILSVSKSTSLATRLRLRASSSDDSSTNYNFRRLYGQASTPYAMELGTNYTQVDTSGTPDSQMVMDILNPYGSAYTFGLWQWQDVSSVLGQGTFRHSVSTAFDGISFYASAGTITGSVAVYGYAKD